MVETQLPPGSIASQDLFERLNIAYEQAYSDNALQVGCTQQLISLLSGPSQILDVGCGTGKPVAALLASAHHIVTGFDIAPRMVEIARQAVPTGSFTAADWLSYQPPSKYDAVVVMFSHLQADTWGEFHAAMWKFAEAVKTGGFLVIGTVTADRFVPEQDEAKVYDETRSYVEDYAVPFLGEMVKSFHLSREGMERFVLSLGLEIVYQKVEIFQPKHPKAVGEEQQYIIAKRVHDAPLSEPKPYPKKG